MDKALNINYKERLAQEIEDIDKLLQTPRLIQDYAVNILTGILENQGRANYERMHILDNQAISNGIQAIRNLHNTSIQKNLEQIYSQMCILAVSSLEAWLKNYFEMQANNYQSLNFDNKKLKEIKITVQELIDKELRFEGKLGKLILDKDKPNFQDLKSIKDVFSDYFGKHITLEPSIEKELCFYLESRHILVHKAGIVDERFVRAVSSRGANLKNLKKGDRIILTDKDWAKIKATLPILMEAATA